MSAAEATRPVLGTARIEFKGKVDLATAWVNDLPNTTVLSNGPCAVRRRVRGEDAPADASWRCPYVRISCRYSLSLPTRHPGQDVYVFRVRCQGGQRAHTRRVRCN